MVDLLGAGVVPTSSRQPPPASSVATPCLSGQVGQLGTCPVPGQLPHRRSNAPASAFPGRVNWLVRGVRLLHIRVRSETIPGREEGRLEE